MKDSQFLQRGEGIRMPLEGADFKSVKGTLLTSAGIKEGWAGSVLMWFNDLKLYVLYILR